MFMGIQLDPSLEWQIQKNITINKEDTQRKLLLASPTTIGQQILVFDTIIIPNMAYAYYITIQMHNNVLWDNKIMQNIPHIHTIYREYSTYYSQSHKTLL